MTNLYDALITEILPFALGSTNESKALAYAVSMAMKNTLNMSDKTTVYSNINNLNSEVLDVLAMEFRVPYYLTTYSIEQKRLCVKNAFKWHSIAGTPGAIKGLLEDIYDNVEVNEWFSYSGSPYHFRVEIGLEDDSIPSTEEQARTTGIINTFKNTRSVLDYVNFYESGTNSTYYLNMGVVGETLIETAVAS